MSEIKQGPIPILKIKNTLVVSLQRTLHGRDAENLISDITVAISRTSAKFLIIDISGVKIVDSFIARTMNNIASMTKSMGCQMLIVGMKPEIAITLVEMGIELKGVITALNLEHGLEKAERLAEKPFEEEYG
ncbi:MAG: STAS domain-containing protein [Thermoplasmata archaeon]